MSFIRFSLAALALLPLAAAFNEASACACCSNRGQRYVETRELQDYQWVEIDRMRFGATAELFVGEADTDEVTGIANPDSSYAMTATRDGKKITFTFKGADRGNGTLSMVLPDKIAFFEVDPREAETPEPSLYKEWKFTAEPTGTGDFAAGAGKGQHLTLILQGRGNNCVNAEDFGHWSMVMEGPKGNYLLFGDMGTPQ
ncbi:hypothetical protein sos41_35260 [Alphaproteobacteria bacterium SO-S41]|nr:hypothetical protein sos41_35260 [Alphaproteobacteria bacterium SO-S41]